MSYQNEEASLQMEDFDDLKTDKNNFSQTNSSKNNNFGAVFILLFTLSTFAIYTFAPASLTSSLKSTVFGVDCPVDTSFIGINISSPDYGSLDSLQYLPWDYMIEPYRDQYLEITEFIVNDEDRMYQLDKNTVTWEINGETYTGSSVTVNVKTTGVLNATVSIYDTQAIKTYTRIVTVAVKYVRRELRSMTTDDQNTFITTLRMLYDVDMTTGQAKYGSKFFNAEYFLAKHLTGAGTTDCDHWHDGAGSDFSSIVFDSISNRCEFAIT